MKVAAIWGALAILIVVPLVIAATSPLLAWRDPIYILAGLTGVAALAVMLVQPLLAAGALPGLTQARARRVHLVLGTALTALVLAHVGGLWLTSPPDVIDVLLLRSPTPFAVWGLAAMWAVFVSAGFAMLYRRRRIPPRFWRRLHSTLAVVAVGGTVVHALLIEGTMGQISKIVLCAATAGALGWALWQRRVWSGLRRR